MFLFIICIILFFSVYACDQCYGKGYSIIFEECPLCLGEGKISPAYYGKNIGLKRWTENLWTGNQYNVRHKSYSLYDCPVCSRSNNDGMLKTIKECENCKHDLTSLNKQNFRTIIRNMKIYKVPIDFKPVDEQENSFFWTKVAYEMKNSWKFDSKRAQMLLAQRLSGKWLFDVASIRYNNLNHDTSISQLKRRMCFED